MKIDTITLEVLADQREELRSETDEEAQRRAAIASLAHLDPDAVFAHLQSLSPSLRRPTQQQTTLQC
ncbi:hypothetical protein [Deinococcus roseus]|uniref:Uncharacterized protein n=1 Tax=Deinococcus roseus TaxID=392414 RepID=A0ABQ2DEY7_9DEIO|nr:hypothetical protein [Deinococcus roseus]GGJ55058.1 hypothetical protein GCM10008938_46430 [Deinococcus roseus]